MGWTYGGIVGRRRGEMDYREGRGADEKRGNERRWKPL